MKLIAPELQDPARFRLHVLMHYYKYGIRSTMDAFKLPRTTIYTWKKKYENSGKKSSSLIPRTTRPHNTRTQTLDPLLVEFIKSMRQEYGKVGRAKIKIFLDEYARQMDKKTYGTTKIGIIIKRKGLTYTKTKKKRKRPLTCRVKRSPKEQIPGYIEMDTVHLWVLSRKYYFMTAIDVVTRFAWVSLVKSPSSKWARQAFLAFTKKYKHQIRVVQTDNGSEFLGEFHGHLEDNNITHQFSYPRTPQINGYVERFNRTLKEEFLYRYELDITEEKFNHKLTNYLIWYNTKRPHQSLNMKSPLQYMQDFN